MNRQTESQNQPGKEKHGGSSAPEPFYAPVLRRKRGRVSPPSGGSGVHTPRAEKPSAPGFLSAVEGRRLTAGIPSCAGDPVFPALSPEAQKMTEELGGILSAVFPLDKKKRKAMLHDIRNLSRMLTDSRGERPLGYMNRPANLSAYAHYFLWWNIVRLARLFAGLQPGSSLPDHFAAVDLGSGPLTAVCALWIACPALREKAVTWYCLDISREALSAGEEIFRRLSASSGAAVRWRIVRIRGEIGVGLKEKAALVVSANVFNELPDPARAAERTGGFRVQADFDDGNGSKASRVSSAAAGAFSLVSSYAAANCEILLVEPGNPDGGALVSGFRKQALTAGFVPVSPCPHTGKCPFPGSRRKKWCHFAFPSASAPAELLSLSKQAGLPKERAALSFLYAVRNGAKRPQKMPDIKKREETRGGHRAAPDAGVFPVRILSEKIRLPGGATGRYGCSPSGMVLLAAERGFSDGSPAQFLDGLPFGALVPLDFPAAELPVPDEAARDPVSGAAVIGLVSSRKDFRRRPAHRRGDRSRTISRTAGGRRGGRGDKAR